MYRREEGGSSSQPRWLKKKKLEVCRAQNERKGKSVHVKRGSETHYRSDSREGGSPAGEGREKEGRVLFDKLLDFEDGVGGHS